MALAQEASSVFCVGEIGRLEPEKIGSGSTIVLAWGFSSDEAAEGRPPGQSWFGWIKGATPW